MATKQNKTKELIQIKELDKKNNEKVEHTAPKKSKKTRTTKRNIHVYPN